MDSSADIPREHAFALATLQRFRGNRRSGSGAASRHGWRRASFTINLGLVIQALQPWMSSKDIESGQRWFDEIAAQLHSSNFGSTIAPSLRVHQFLREHATPRFEAGRRGGSRQLARKFPRIPAGVHGCNPSRKSLEL